MRELKDIFTKDKIADVIYLISKQLNINHFSVIRWFYTQRKPSKSLFLKLFYIINKSNLFDEKEKKEINEKLKNLYKKYYNF
ncbi:MAG: hypothetical protein QXJ06_00525 [Candidatus Aenigmatarchaeota archaeon]